MSRSRRHNPFHGMTTAESEKKDKRIANRKLRAITRDTLKHIQRDADVDGIEFLNLEEVSDVWTMDKDGRVRFDKNSEYYEKIMRK